MIQLTSSSSFLTPSTAIVPAITFTDPPGLGTWFRLSRPRFGTRDTKLHSASVVLWPTVSRLRKYMYQSGGVLGSLADP